MLAFVMFATLLVPATVMRAKSFPSSRRPFLDLKIFHEMPWLLFRYVLVERIDSIKVNVSQFVTQIISAKN